MEKKVVIYTGTLEKGLEGKEGSVTNMFKDGYLFVDFSGDSRIVHESDIKEKKIIKNKANVL